MPKISAEKSKVNKISIKKITFDGFDAVEIKTAKLKLIAVISMGPRIAYFGKIDGRNLLFWDYPKKYQRGEWQFMGGHRIWCTRPKADECEESYAADNDPCTVKILKDGMEIHGGIHPTFRIRKSMIIRVIDENKIEIENRITNESPMLWSGGVWSLTVTLPSASSEYGIPLGREGAWDIFNIAIPKRWAETQRALVNDPAIRFTEDCLILKPKGSISKRMVQAPQGLIGMTDSKEKISFLKHSPYLENGQYPLNCNIAYYVGLKNFMVEMEYMGPEQSVMPSAFASTKETWELTAPIDWKKIKGVFTK